MWCFRISLTPHSAINWLGCIIRMVTVEILTFIYKRTFRSSHPSLWGKLYHLCCTIYVWGLQPLSVMLRESGFHKLPAAKRRRRHTLSIHTHLALALSCLNCYPQFSPSPLMYNTYNTHVLAGFCQLDTHLDVSGKSRSQLRKASIILGYRQIYGGIVLINDWCGRAQLTVGGAAPGQVVLSCIRKQASRSWRKNQ